MVDTLSELLIQLPKSAVILMVGNPYTYTFHVGIEVLKRAFMKYRWYIVANDIPQKYMDVITRFNVFKDDITFIDNLGKGMEVLKESLLNNGNLTYILINDSTSHISEYYSILTRRNQTVNSITVIQIDEEIHKPLAYVADLIVKLGVVEDSSTFKTVARLAKIILVGRAIEAALNYRVLPNEVMFEEFVRI